MHQQLLPSKQQYDAAMHQVPLSQEGWKSSLAINHKQSKLIGGNSLAFACGRVLVAWQPQMSSSAWFLSQTPAAELKLHNATGLERVQCPLSKLVQANAIIERQSQQ